MVTLPDDVYKRDHAFWSKYSERFIGNWITTNTTVAEITNFVEKVYLQHDYNNFKGDLKFPMTACVDIAEVATRHTG